MVYLNLDGRFCLTFKDFCKGQHKAVQMEIGPLYLKVQSRQVNGKKNLIGTSLKGADSYRVFLLRTFQDI